MGSLSRFLFYQFESFERFLSRVGLHDAALDYSAFFKQGFQCRRRPPPAPRYVFSDLPFGFATRVVAKVPGWHASKVFRLMSRQA